MSNLAARHARRTEDLHRQRVKDLTAVIAGATADGYRPPAALADIIIRAGYRRKRRKRESRDDLHLAVASCGDDGGGEP